MRCFIAIELTGPVKTALSGIEEELKKSKADVRWVKPDNIHLTLKFLGNVEDRKAGEIAAAVEKISARCAPFLIEVKGVGMFPGGESPRVLWAGIEDGGGLQTLKEEVDSVMETLGFEHDARKFIPHLTLGRFRSSAGREDLIKNIRRHEKESFGSLTVKAVTFIKSDLHPAGARYTTVSEALLKQAG